MHLLNPPNPLRLVEKNTWALMEKWKQTVDPHSWGFMLRRISMGLVRTRADSWARRVVDSGLDDIEKAARVEWAKKRGKKTKKGSGEVVETGERRIGEGLEEE
jgi:hypothetical protein